MSDKFGDERDPYLYPALNVLRNRLGIRRAKNLQQAAFEMTALRAATLPLGPRVRGLPYLCAIHHQLYQDLFDWAGRLREVNPTGRYAILPLCPDRGGGECPDAGP